MPILKRAPGALFVLIASLSFVLPSVTRLASAQEAEPRSVILLSWDGVRRDKLKELRNWRLFNEIAPLCPSRKHEAVVPQLCGYFWSCLPNICNFQLVDSRVAPGKSLTRVQTASMLTGMLPSETGVLTNSGASSVPPGSTIYERLMNDLPEHPAMGHIGSWVYTVSGILTTARDTAVPSAYIQSRGVNDKSTGLNTNIKLFELLDNDEFRSKQFFIFAHIKGADVVAHGTGDSDDAYLEAIVQADLRLGELMAKLDENGMRDRTDVYVTTDHGFYKRFHLGSAFHKSVSETFIASSARDLQCFAKGNVIDVVPTILEKMGAPLLDPSPLQGRSLLARPGDPAFCWPGVCGDGVVASDEDCEPGVAVGTTCEELGLIRGTVGCTDSCEFDVGTCVGLHPEMDVRISRHGDASTSFLLRSRTKDTGGIPLLPAVTDFVVSVTGPTADTWSCRIEQYRYGEWRRGITKFRWSGRGLDCGLRTVTFIVNEERPYQMKLKAQVEDGFPVVLGGQDILVGISVAGLNFEIELACTVSSGSGALRCSDPLADNSNAGQKSADERSARKHAAHEH